MQAEPTLAAFEQAVSRLANGGSPHEIEESWLVAHCPFFAYARHVGCELPPMATTALERLTDEQQTKALFEGGSSELSDAATNILKSISDGETVPSTADARRLALLMSGLAHTVSAAVAIIGRDDDSTRTRCLTAMMGLSQAWPVDLRDGWQPETALPDSLKVAKRDTTTQSLYTLAALKDFQQAAKTAQINVSGWLMFERLLRYLLKEDAEEEVDEHKVTAPVLLYNRHSHRGHVCTFQIRACTASLSGVFIDPLASGLMIGDGELIQSLQFASHISRGALLHRAQAENCQVALRLAPDPPTEFSGHLPLFIEGASGGLILACGLNAAAERRPLNRKATATARLSIQVDAANPRLLWNDQIEIGEVLPESIPAKFKAARREGIEHVALCPAQEEQFKSHEAAQGLNVVGAATYRDCYQFVTSDADLDGVLREYGEAVVQHWQEDKQLNKSEHRIDRFVYPSFSLMPTGRTPFNVTRTLLSASSSDAEDLGEPAYQPIKETAEKGYIAALHSGRWQCWIEDAGAGKSVFAWKSQAYLSSPQGQREFFQGKPCLAVWWEGQWPCFEESGRFKTLATALRDELLEHVPKLSKADAQRTVEYALREGRVVLIVDALDQFTERHLRQLKNVFADRALKNCRVILTSRDYKVHDEQTFFGAAEWRYGRIDGFTTDAQRDAYFPEERREQWRKMIPDEREVREGVDELLRSPLVLRMILEILEDLRAGEQPKPFHNRGDLYWEAAQRLLRRAVEKENDYERIERWDDRDELLRELRRVLSTIALEMMLDKDGLVSEARRYAIARANIEPFLRQAEQRYLRDVPDYQKPTSGAHLVVGNRRRDIRTGIGVLRPGVCCAAATSTASTTTRWPASTTLVFVLRRGGVFRVVLPNSDSLFSEL